MWKKLCFIGLQFLIFRVVVFGATPVFEAAKSYSVESYPRTIAAADLDGDGDQDLVVANTAPNEVSVLKNNGDGTFASRINYMYCPT